VDRRSGDVLFTLRRYEFTPDEKALQEGPWRLVSATVDGGELPAEEIAAVRTMHMGESEGDPPAELSFTDYDFSTNAKFLTKTLSRGGYPESPLRGRYRLDSSQRPKAISLHCYSSIPPEEEPRGIYELSGDRLRIAWRQGEPRPKEFKSEPGSGVTLLELERERPEAPAGAEPKPKTYKAPPPELSVKIAVPATMRVEDLAEIPITVSNTGGESRGVEVAVRCDPQLDPVRATQEFRREQKAFVWTIDTLPAGASHVLEVHFAGKAEAARACVRVTVTVEGHEPVTAEACVQIDRAKEADEGTSASEHPDHEAIQGVWQAVAGTFQGEDLPKHVEFTQMVLAQGRYLSTRAGLEGSLSSGTYVLDATRDPKWIDFEVPEGGFEVPEGGFEVPEGGFEVPEGGFEVPEGDQKAVAIYELDADRMRMCYSMPGSARPTRFVSEEEPPNNGLLVELTRVGSAEAALKRLQAAEQEAADVNLKRIGVAMHNFHDTWKHFPPAVLRHVLPDTLPRVQAPAAPLGAGVGPAVPWAGASNLRPSQPYSWRVALLPYLGQAPLYEQYRFDEPWDSPANKKVLDEMPDVYRHPSDPPEVTNSAYYAVVGPGTIFDGEQGRRFADVVDGTRYTILVVEAKREAPWTKPEDVPFDPDKPLPELGGFTEGGFRALLADGSVRFIPKSIDETMLRSLFQRADRQKVDWSELER
jgi:uncharacterized protein (TIGR03067 family)